MNLLDIGQYRQRSAETFAKLGAPASVSNKQEFKEELENVMGSADRELSDTNMLVGMLKLFGMHRN